MTNLNTIQGELVEKEKANNIDLELYKPHHIKHKLEYNAFLKSLKNKSFTTAYMMAKALNVSAQTIAQWLRTPKAIKIMQEDIDHYIVKIKQSKDWKAQAYLLDKVTAGSEGDQAKNMIGLNIIIQGSKDK